MEESPLLKAFDPNLPVVFNNRLPEEAGTADLRRLIRCSTPAARSKISFEQAERLQILPLSIQGGQDSEEVLVVLSTESLGPVMLSELRFAAGVPILVQEFHRRDLLAKAIPAAYRGDSRSLSTAAARATGELAKKTGKTVDRKVMPIRAHAPVPDLLEAILIRAHYLAASDVHIEPQRAAVRLRFRVDGLLRDETEVRLSFEALASLSRHIKVPCNLDLTDRRRPQDGSFSVQLSEAPLRIRVSFLPQNETERVVMRVLRDEKQLEEKCEKAERFDVLGLDREQERILLTHLGLAGGSLIFAGPTGSGKTTLLYSCLEYLNQEWRSVVTIEDPVERILSGINQTQVSPHLGFRDFLPVLLRQDPDVVMVGEMRDSETAETALTAGITGHLVLSTVHAGSCFEILPRLQYLGISGLLLGASLRLLVSQRLLAKNCRECGKETKGTPNLRAFFHLGMNARLIEAVGCDSCGGTGVAGRRGVFEFLPITAAIQEILLRCVSREQAGALLGDVKQQAREEGFRPMAFGIRDALLDGLISPSTACRALGMEPRMFE